jgi:N-acylneuraminate cytidylyltransferase
MSRKIKALIPVRRGSQRVARKNIRKFAGSSLLEIKINQLKRIPGIDEIVVNSDCEQMLQLADEAGVTAVERDPFFASNDVPMNDVWCHLAQVTECDDIIYTNCTNPLLEDDSYIEALAQYQDLPAGYDSLTTVNAVQEYLWSGPTAVNYDPAHHPRSQDLPLYHALNFAISIIPRELMIANKSILGNKFFQFTISNVEAIDVDTMEDFIIAESAYSKLILGSD